MKRKKTYHHEDLRGALIRSALKIISKHGIEDLTLREVARLAGVSHAAPYRHFKSKNELLAAVAEDGFKKLFEVQREARKQASPLQQLQALGVSYVLFATKNISHFRVMFAREFADKKEFPGLYEIANQTLNQLKQTIVECQKEKIIVSRNANEIALAAWAMVHGLADLTIAGQVKDLCSPTEMAKVVTEILATGFLRK